jgi:hypothetical protein
MPLVYYFDMFYLLTTFFYFDIFMLIGLAKLCYLQDPMAERKKNLQSDVAMHQILKLLQLHLLHTLNYTFLNKEMI